MEKKELTEESIEYTTWCPFDGTEVELDDYEMIEEDNGESESC